jgi:dephospho-CoA kinase
LILAGLTGSIATGKSTVSAFLEDAGAVIVDADKIARDVVQHGQPAWQDIVNHFGRTILLPDGEINRPRLGDIIFNDPEQKKILNAIVHPRVTAETTARLEDIEKSCPNAVVILDIPLLVETETRRDFDEIIVVYVPEALQIQRLMARDSLTHEQALARIRSQMPIEEKKRHATVVIDNSGSREETRIQTIAAYNRLSAHMKQKIS